jgi:hypothetical protein
MFRRHGIWVVLAALIAGNTLFATVIGTPQAQFRHLYTLGANGSVVLQNVYGDVSISAWDRDDVLVEAIKRSPDPTRLADARIIVEPTAGQLSIHTQYSGSDGDHPASVEYRITVPRSASLPDIKLINGGLSLTGLGGSVKASSVNGNIKAQRLTGEVDLSTMNGGLEADFLNVNPAKPISLSTINGPIHLSIPAASRPALVAQNLSGGIASDLGRVFRTSAGQHLVVRGGGVQIHVNNVNGGISIRCHERPLT